MSQPCTQEKRIDKLEEAFTSVAKVHQAVFGTNNEDGVMYKLNELDGRLKLHERILWVLTGVAIASGSGVIQTVLAKFI